MNTYVTGTTIKTLREGRNLTQAELAERIGVSSKTVSKWETGKGLPDISLLQPLALALGISVIELMNGEQITNRNVSANMLRSKFYVCPVCGNVIHSTGNADYNPFESFKKAASQPMAEDEAAMMVLHPGFVDEYILNTSYITTARALEVAFAINPEVPKWCEENGVQLVTYADL